MSVAASSSLALRALLKTAADRGGLTRAPAKITGLTPSAVAWHAAVRAIDTPHFVVVPSDTDVEQMTSDARFFLAALKGLSDRDLERQVLPFPSQEVDPYRGLAPHLEIASARAAALYALSTGTARIVVASARALLPRLGAPGTLSASGIVLTAGMEISPQDLGEKLGLAGFAREDPVDEHGEFCVRGGIVDIFPAAEAHPVRLEFIGDTIETMRTYDPSTQRSILPVDQVAIVPLRDVLEDDRRATLFDYLARGNEPSVVVSEPDEVESHVVKRLEQLQQSYETIVAAATTPAMSVAPPSELFASLDLIESRLASATQLAMLGLDASAPGAGDADQQAIKCQPAVELKGRVADWVAEIRRRRDEGETTLFVAATHGRAERTIELLKEYDVFAIPVERAEDARYAAVLVAIGSLSRGFRLPDAGLQIYAEADVFEEERRAPERRRSASKAFLSDLRDLKVGDFVVHVDHGIGLFVGLRQIGVDDASQEFLELRYAGEDKLFVPV